MLNKLQHTHLVTLFFFSYLIFWSVVSLLTNIHPDSADHWGWSKKLQFVYLEHPPMVAYWMKAISFIIPNNILAIKLGGVFSSMLVLCAAYLAAREFLNKQASLIYLLILHSTFYYSLFSQFWFVDQAYNFFWFLSLWTVGKYLNTENKKWLLLLGLFIGMGAMSKYIIVLFCIILFFWLLWDKKHRPLLWSPYLWVAGIITILVLSPIIYTDAQNNWAAFQFVFKKGFKDKLVLENLFFFQGGHVFFYSIFLSIPAWYFLLRGRFKNLFETSKFRFLLVHSLVPILFFSYSSIKGRLADPNWLNGSYIALYVFLAGYFYFLLQKSKKTFSIVCISLSHLVVFSLLVVFLLFQKHQFSFFPADLTERMNETNGWQIISKKTQKLFKENNKILPQYIITKHFFLGQLV